MSVSPGILAVSVEICITFQNQNSSLLGMFFEICLALIHIAGHGIFSWFPIDRTDLTVFVKLLECLNNAQGFVNTSPNRRFIQSDLTNDAVGEMRNEPRRENPLSRNKTP